MAEMLSTRGLKVAQAPSPMLHITAKVSANPFHPERNPEGIINLGNADNTLCCDLIQAKMQQELKFDETHQFYPGSKFMLSMNKKIAAFLEEFMGALEPLDATKIHVYNGCDSIMVALATILADPGEYFMTTAPGYYQFEHDFLDIPGVNTCFVDLTSQSSSGPVTFDLTAEKVDRALTEAAEEGKRVRAFVLSNPCNPLGELYAEELIRQVLEVCKKHSVHAIVDEIYALTVYGEEATPQSMLSYPDLPDPERTHYLWGASKDLGLSGTRFGVLYTTNELVSSAAGSLNYFHYTPPLVVEAVTNILADTAWMRDTYLPTNKQRIRESYRFMKAGLEDLGVVVWPSCAGFFLWADFGQFMKDKTEEEERKLFTALIEQAGVFINPGSKLGCSIGGWFRIIFTHPIPTLQTALERIRTLVESPTV